jgi:tetratricopeptide (TPR) repeat protein
MVASKYIASGLISAFVFSASVAVAAPEKKKDKTKKGTEVAAPAANTPDPAREKLEAAMKLMKGEDYGAASVAFYDLATSEKTVGDDAEYNLAKSLYRLGLYHSALDHFASLLSKGPANRYHASALEWCLFISRKVVGDDRVHEAIARYAAADFPKEYRDELLFSLARFHYQRAIQVESGALAVQTTGETKIKESALGVKSISADVFEGEDEEPAPEAAEGEGEEPGVKKKEGGGLSLDEDIFGDDEPTTAAKKDDEKKGKKGKKGKREKEKEKELVKEEPKKEDPKKSEPVVAEKKERAPGKDEPFVLTAKEHTEQAAKLIAQVSENSTYGARAKFLEGLILYKQQRENDALEAFKKVVRITRPGETTEDERLREIAFFQLARTHFGAKQPSYSIFYYDKVDPDSYAWLDAIYEASWAEFRLGNFEKALGNLLTLHSPFFKDEYYPESLILKAVIYYENCRYPEAKEILTDFLKKYEPVEAELAKITERDQAPAKYYEALENLRAGSDIAGNDQSRAQIMSQILSIALADSELSRLDLAYREVDSEVKSFAAQGGGFPQSRLAVHLNESLGKARDDLARDAGRAVKRTLEHERDAIKTLIQQSVRIDIETSRAEQERIEATLQGKQTAPKDKDREFVEWSNDERSVWPFTGEYWRDELGTYQLTLAHSCQTQVAQAE